LIWSEINYATKNQTALISVTYGPVFWLHAFYSYSLIFSSTFLIFQAFRRWSQPYRRQAGIVLISALIPWLGNLVYMLQINPNSNLDLTSFCFAISGLIACWGLFSFKLLEIVPIAQNAIVEKMTDGLIVLDIQGKIVYLNPAILNILKQPIEELTGKFASDVLSPWIDDLIFHPEQGVESPSDNMNNYREVSVEVQNIQKYYEITVSPIEDSTGLPTGHTIIWRDITRRKQEEKGLRQQVAELTILHAVASACAQAEDEDTLIQNVNQIIAEGYFPDNFGIILIDRESNQLIKHSSYRDLLGASNAAYPLGKGITGRVAAEGQALRVPDVSKDPSYWKVDPKIKSELCVPLKVGEQIIGVINAESTKLDAYSEEDEHLLVIFAGQLATAIERLRAEAAEKQRVQELSAITRVSSEISSVLDQQEVLNLIVRSAAEISTSDASGLFSYREDGRLYLVAAYGISDQFYDSLSRHGVPINGTAVGEASKLLAPVQIPDLKNSKTYATPELAEIDGIQSILALPMLRGEQLLGGIVLWHKKPRHFTIEEEAFLQVLANQSVNAVENARLFEAEREQRRIAEVLRETGYELSTSLEFEHILDRLLDQLERLVPYDAANIMLVENDWIRVVRSRGYSSYGEHIAEQITSLELEIKTTPNLKQLFESKTPLIIPNTDIDPDWVPVFYNGLFNSWAGAPVILQDEVVAFFSLDKTTPNSYQPEHIERLAVFSGQASLAWQNAKLFEETHRRAVIQEALNEIIEAVVAAPNLDQLLETVMELMMNALEVEKSGIWAAGHSVIHGLPRNIGEIDTRVNQQSPRLAAIFQNKLVIEDWSHIQETDELRAWKRHMENFHIRASLYAPVISGDKRIGALALSSTTPRIWLPEEIALAEAVGRQIGSAVERLDLLAKTQEQAQQVKHIIETVPEGVILLDTERRILLVNPAAEKYLSMLLDENELDKPLSHLAEKPIEEMLKILPGSPWQEIQVQKEPRLIFEFAARPLESKDQNEGWVLVLRDVTLDRENQARIQMQERLATVGQLAAGIAHDFNNIMAAVVIYTDLLAMEPNLKPASLEQLNIVQQQVQRATSLIRQILDFSRRAVMEQSEIDLLPFIKELDKLLVRVLPENIQLKLSHQPGPYQVLADPTRLQQVFMNLVLNARDAMPEGGTLQFSLDKLSLKPEDTIPAPDLTAGNWIRIKIQDSGSGIPDEMLPHIFEPFFTTKPIGQGTGLGLAQVYGIIKQHGGTIDVYSIESKGSTFSIYLPELTQKLETTPEKPNDFQPIGTGETVLVVEDDQSARDALQTLMELQNFRILTAANGKRALEIFERQGNLIDLIVSDVVMPEMGGVELFNIIQNKQSQIKFLFITGHPLDFDTQLTSETNEVHWLQKPFSVNEFLEVLNKILLAE
jgi:PAS domain S-box-containing protein